MISYIDSQVTFFKSLTKPGEGTNGKLSDLLDRVSKFDDYDNTLAETYINDKKRYKQLKGKLPGFVFGSFTERKIEGLSSYSPIMGFDIDGVKSRTQTDSILEQIKSIDYVISAFPSVSGHGVRVIVNTTSTKQTHKTVYGQILSDLSTKIHLPAGVKFDKATNDISRLWFYAPVQKSEFYINSSAKEFKLTTSKLAALTEDQKDVIIRDILRTRNLTGRNVFVMQYCKMAFEYNLSKDYVLKQMLQFEEPDFKKNEIVGVVNRNCTPSKIYDDNQLKSYARSILGPSYDVSNNSPAERNNKQEETKKNENQYIKIRNYLFEKYDFRRNEISLDIEVRQKSKEFYEELNDDDLICELLEADFKNVDKTLRAILRSSQITKYNPLRDYLDNLPKWDETKPDYIGQLSSYVTAKKQDWFNSQFKKMLVRNLACSLNYIPFNKHCFTLIGNQNDGKTSFIRFLCPYKLKQYYTENLSLDKDGRISIAQNLFVNLDEIATISYQDRNKIKALISTDHVKERLPYGTKAIKINRIANFFASTNDTEILTDNTGNVRWLIFEIDHINHASGGPKGYSKNVDIDNVYAQAFYLLENGYKYQLTADEIKKSESNNSDHIVSYAELDLIQEYFEKDIERNAENFTTTTHIIDKLLELHPKQKFSSSMIGRALRQLNIPKVNGYRLNDKNRRKGYYLKERVFSKKSDSSDSLELSPWNTDSFPESLYKR